MPLTNPTAPHDGSHLGWNVWTWPNLISAVRLLLVAPFVWCVLHVDSDAARWSAIGIGFAMGGGDWLDGYLARRLQQFSPLGEKLDPLADKAAITACTILLALPDSGLAGADGQPLTIPVEAAVAILGKDVLVLLGGAVVALRVGRTRLPARWWGKASTVAQFVMGGLLLGFPDWPSWTREPVIWLCRLSGLFALAAAVDYFCFGWRLLRGGQADDPLAE